MIAAALVDLAGLAALLAALAVSLRLVRRALARERLAILGAGPVAERLERHLRQPGVRRLAVVGRFEDTTDGIASLRRLGREGGIDRIVVALPGGDGSRLRRVVWQLKTLDLPVARYATLADADWLGIPLGRLHDLPVACLVERPIPRWGRAVKTVADAALSLALIVALLPALLAVAVAIRLDSPGPILFRQQREGRNGADFQILKFRTMVCRPAPADGRVRQTERADARVTRVGRLLRATSLDELPQLFNVLRGDMSLIGPRPHPSLMTTAHRLSTEIAEDYPQRHRVRPGMTGWAQVNGSRGALADADALRRRLNYDLDYIENWSPLLDLKIALLTPIRLIFHGGSAY